MNSAADDITLMRVLTTHKQRGRLYYYAGNFFYPLSVMNPGEIKGAIKRFIKDNREMIKADRARPEYRTRLQLAAEQLAIKL